LSDLYGGFLNTNVRVGAGDFEISKPFLLWINDGLMAIFFFLVGLEIKREVLRGELSSIDKAILPLVAAVGGMAGPALIYLWINAGNAQTMNGWAIPAATDIAFALGILALVGSRVPASLKVLLLAIAVIDDLGAIVIIALFYSSDLSTGALTFSLLAFVIAVAMNRMGVKKSWPYIVLGIIMWVAVLKSGVHATLAGVLIALTIPIKEEDGDKSMLHRMEHDLHGWVTFLILPLFAFANAGVSLAGLSVSMLFDPLPLGIALGLFFGKQIGVFGTAWIAIKTGIANMPARVNWVHLYGVAGLTGIGFTMSLFIGALAFDGNDMADKVRLGVLMGSIASGILGYTVLKLSTK
jgi:NhaA family Na+:H+ antiporter